MIYPWVEHVIIRLWVISMSMVIIFLGVKYNYKGAYYYFYFVVLCHVCRPLPARLFLKVHVSDVWTHFARISVPRIIRLTLHLDPDSHQPLQHTHTDDETTTTTTLIVYILACFTTFSPTSGVIFARISICNV